MQHHSSPYLTWFSSSTVKDDLVAIWAAAEVVPDRCAMEKFGAVWETGLGLMQSRWMSRSQRAAVAGQHEGVMAVIPLPPMAFIESTVESEAGLPTEVAAAFEVARLRTAGEGGGHYVDRVKQEKWDHFLLTSGPFGEIFTRAWRSDQKTDG